MKALKKAAKLIRDGYTGAGIVYICGDEVLMQLRRHPHVWSFVGGGYDKYKDQDLLDTAIREFYEETGISLARSDVEAKPLHKLGFWKYKWHLYLVISDVKRSTDDAPSMYRCEYERYKYVHIPEYKEEIAADGDMGFFFFVPHQMKLLLKRLKFK